MKYDNYIKEIISKEDPVVAGFLEKEIDRQKNTVELIASENFVSDAIKAACGSVFTNKYAEGYPNYGRHSGREGRYYGGCENIDALEEYCCNKWREAFNTDYHVNVQPHSGSQANYAAYASVLKCGDTILSMDMNSGAHLTHSSQVSFVSKMYNVVTYGLDENGRVNYEEIAKKIMEYKPALILAGASSYPREIDFKRIKTIIETASVICEKMNVDYHPIFMVDMAHIAGLVVAGLHQSPFGEADIITTTSHKTLRGPRGGLIFCRQELAKKVDGAVFPGSQGGPLEHIIAAKAICATNACTNEFKEYIRNVVENTSAMANEFTKLGYEVVTSGTDNHLFVLNFAKTHPWLTGLALQNECDKNNITLNKNCVPNDPRGPKETSGVRIGCAAETTKGKTKEDFVKIAQKIDKIIKNMKDGYTK